MNVKSNEPNLGKLSSHVLEYRHQNVLGHNVKLCLSAEHLHIVIHWHRLGIMVSFQPMRNSNPWCLAIEFMSNHIHINSYPLFKVGLLIHYI